MIRKIFLFLLVVLLLAVFFNWSLLVYGVSQGWGQLSIVWKAKPVSTFLDNTSFPDSLKRKLRLIDEVRKYAIDSLGLKDTENYKTLYDQKGREVMWVVTASEAYRLKPKLWTFPVVGSVPYKGFFNKEEALNESKVLMDAGWDVSVRNPGGWSTLGWFTDPILSGMLHRSEGDLAGLIIHEMVHATLWVPDSTDFNENLASFIGDTASYSFLYWKFGPDSPEYRQYLYEDQDYGKFSVFILRAAQQLDSLYQSMGEGMSMGEKKMKKDSAIMHIVRSMDTLKLRLNPTPSVRYEKRLPNNTYFMAYRYYQSRQSTFKEEFNQQFGGNVKAYIKHLSSKYPAD